MIHPAGPTSTIRLDVAILGGGFAGVACAQALSRALGRHPPHRVGLISEENHMVFQPMLAEVAGGSLSPRHVVNPLRLLCPRAEILRGAIEEIDLTERRLTLKAGPFSGLITVFFEQLVLALGAAVDLRRIPGMPEHAFLMQNVGDAMLLRTTIIARIEEASLETRPHIRQRLLSFVVVGGGYSGTETAGQILDLFHSIHRFYPSIAREDLQVTLIHSRDHLLPTLSRRLGEYAARKLQQRGLRLILNQRVRAVTAHRVLLGDDSVVESSTVVSTVGNAQHPLMKRLCEEYGLPTEQGRLLTDASCRVPGCESLWAAGDCAAVPLPKGGHSPANAQFATRQGKLLGRNIARALRGKEARPFAFQGLGEIAAIGHYQAVGSIFGINFSGFFAWWLWRTIYLTKLPRLDRKLRVMVEWTLDLFFPKDINLLSPRFSTPFREAYLAKGDLLFQRGEPAFSLYIVRRGRIEIFDEHGVVKVAGPGDFFGERALLEESLYDFTARAAQDSTVVSLPAGAFQQIVAGGGSLSRLFEKSARQYQSRETVEAIAHRIPDDLQSLTAQDLAQTDVATVSPHTTLAEALELARRRPHTLYPVVDGEGRTLGALHREDLYDLLKRPETYDQLKVSAAPLRSLPQASPLLPVTQIAERLIRSGENKLLLVDDEQRLRGILTLMDLLNPPRKVRQSPESPDGNPPQD
jgi:NADH:ubiquinone reductase (H+-translocating)